MGPGVSLGSCLCLGLWNPITMEVAKPLLASERGDMIVSTANAGRCGREEAEIWWTYSRAGGCA